MAEEAVDATYLVHDPTPEIVDPHDFLLGRSYCGLARFLKPAVQQPGLGDLQRHCREVRGHRRLEAGIGAPYCGGFRRRRQMAQRSLRPRELKNFRAQQDARACIERKLWLEDEKKGKFGTV